MQLAQGVGDRDVAARVPEPDRGGQVERAPWPGRRALPAPRRRLHRRRVEPLGESPNLVVDPDRVAGGQPVPAALHEHELAAGQLGEPFADPVAPDPVVGAVHDHHRAA